MQRRKVRDLAPVVGCWQTLSRAVEAGYTDVSLMPEGLHGWRTSGQPLVKVPQS